ncbi:LemA family protein [Halomonas sp. 1390]|uniref:LemA family protein n=1 Tax=Halomonas sp. B23F22_3 TaxID=3459516 RepID=UPI00373DFB46
MSLSLIIPVVLLGLLLVYGVAIYNRLVALKNRYQNAFAQIEVQLKRRHDLIPNLVETAKAYMSHERETLQAVTEARNAAEVGLQHAAARPGEPGPMAELAGAEGALGAALGRLNVVMEAYPELKASENMRQLSETLTTTENRVAFARQAYNDAVMQYNTYRQSFPPVLLAGSFGHKGEAAQLEFDDSAEIQAAPRVTF